MNTMKLASKSIFLTVIFVFSMITLLSVYGHEKTTPNNITDLIKTTAEKIKNMTSEVPNSSTGIITTSEAKNTLNQLGEASKKIALA
jgi:hypothetical protein